MGKRKYKSDISESVHGAIKDMYETGIVTKETMRHFDDACLLPIPELEPKKIKKIREACRVSQPIFARYLNTSESTIEKWESFNKLHSKTPGKQV